MSTVYLIAGLGADARVYRNIKLHGFEVARINWIDPDWADTLTSYAQKLINKFSIIPGSVVIGNSLGGMIAVEIAKIIPLHKVILISSIQTIADRPGTFNFSEYYRFIN